MNISDIGIGPTVFIPEFLLKTPYFQVIDMFIRRELCLGILIKVMTISINVNLPVKH